MWADVQCLPGVSIIIALLCAMHRLCVSLCQMHCHPVFQVAGVDRVTGAITWNEVYLFGHRDASSWVNFVHLDTDNGSITLSEHHYMPTCVEKCESASPSMRYK